MEFYVSSHNLNNGILKHEPDLLRVGEHKFVADGLILSKKMNTYAFSRRRHKHILDANSLILRKNDRILIRKIAA